VSVLLYKKNLKKRKKIAINPTKLKKKKKKKKKKIVLFSCRRSNNTNLKLNVLSFSAN